MFAPAVLRAMHTISGNLQAAEATMQQMASAAQLQGMAPSQQAASDIWVTAAAQPAGQAQGGSQTILAPQRPSSMKLPAPAAPGASAAKATPVLPGAMGKGSRRSTAAATTTKAAGSFTNPKNRQVLGTRG